MRARVQSSTDGSLSPAFRNTPTSFPRKKQSATVHAKLLPWAVYPSAHQACRCRYTHCCGKKLTELLWSRVSIKAGVFQPAAVRTFEGVFFGAKRAEKTVAKPGAFCCAHVQSCTGALKTSNRSYVTTAQCLRTIPTPLLHKRCA